MDKSSVMSYHQLSNPANSGSGLYLQESCDVHDDIPEDVILLLTVEPAEFSDSGVELNQSLSDKRGELRPCRQVVQHVITWWKNHREPRSERELFGVYHVFKYRSTTHVHICVFVVWRLRFRKSSICVSSETDIQKEMQAERRRERQRQTVRQNETYRDRDMDRERKERLRQVEIETETLLACFYLCLLYS